MVRLVVGGWGVRMMVCGSDQNIHMERGKAWWHEWLDMQLHWTWLRKGEWGEGPEKGTSNLVLIHHVECCG